MQINRHDTTAPNGGTGGTEATIGAALDDFLQRRADAGARPNTVAAYRRDIEGVLAHVFPPAGGQPRHHLASDLDAHAFVQGFDVWTTTHRPSSVRRAWSAWNAFWGDLVAAGLRPESPMASVERPEAPSASARTAVPVSTWQLQAIAASVDPRSRHPWPERDAALLGLLLGTGARLGELDGLRTGSVELAAPASVSIVDAMGQARVVPIDDDLRQVISLYLDSRKRHFPHDDVADPGAPLLVDHDGRALARHQAQYLVRRFFERAGVPGAARRGTATLLLRHSYASNAVEEGVDADELRRRLGDRSMATVRRHASSAHLRGGSIGPARRYAEQGQRLEEQRENIAARMERLAARIREFGQPYDVPFGAYDPPGGSAPSGPGSSELRGGEGMAPPSS
ncbi:MAG: site-specific integrase [Actinobacteria bacterium]|nr:site-specific integrase [Actinomycetota bacterium]